MSVPKQRKTSSRTKRGRSHDALKASNLGACASCNAPTKSHRACPKCGTYSGRKTK